MSEDMATKKLSLIKDNYDHKRTVLSIISKICNDLLERGINHDNSKIEDYELYYFAETDRMKDVKFGDDSYKIRIKDINQPLGKALIHHYAYNRHHPEFHENGISDMNLCDLVEMLVDWIASMRCHSHKDVNSSMLFCKERFNISDQLFNVLKNTVNQFIE